MRIRMENISLADAVLHALADAYPQPVHFGYLSLALGVSAGAMWRALQQLRRDALITVDRSLAGSPAPFAQARITGKGLSVSAGITEPTDDAAATLRRLEAVTLDHLQQSRERKPPARAVAGVASRTVAASDPRLGAVAA
jgi:hypothetical protein